MPDLKIAALLQKSMGLKVTSIGKATLDRAVQRRMKTLAIDDKAAYVDKLKTSTIELRELIEEVVIPETWFFRDGVPFQIMNKYLMTEWAPKHKNNIFRALSVPCSTGEEPYSLAMSLLSSGWPAEKFTIHAVDISSRAIARAKKGVYSENSFRGSDLAYRTNYFTKKKKENILNENVRKKVHFHHGNILNNVFMQGLGTFDVIFCRNVLIYFDALSRHQAITTLYNILNKTGILFVGHAEANLLRESPFMPAPFQQSFAFYKKPEQQLRAERKAPAPEEIKKNKLKPRSFKHKYPFQKNRDSKKPDLELAHELADKGELEKATEICEEFLSQYGSSAQAFYLLGIIHNTEDDTVQAEKLFRKAIYLDPNHEESLLFLSLLTEKAGNVKEAELLRKRVERLQEKPGQQQKQNS
ncbi:MAG: CheR family methyltransferase [Desulfobulbales bacterium]|nr:CheR family methyltransferase [Desulfobulbales bacterium]